MPIARSRTLRSRLVQTVLLAMAASLVLPAVATAGVPNPDLDPTFGDHGRVLTTFPRGGDARDIERVGNRVLAIGLSNLGGQVPARIAMYRSFQGGGPDPAFGGDGKIVVGFPGGSVTGEALAVLPNREFVVGATFDPDGDETNATFALARFHQNGTLDTSFGHGGRVVADLGPESWFLHGLVRMADGRLLAIGERFAPQVTIESSFGLARFEANGDIDESFGDHGSVVTAFHLAGGGRHQESGANEVAIDTQGRAIVAGWATNDDCHYRFALARYRSTGELDPSFGGDGRVTTGFSNGSAQALAVEVGDDNRITVAGSNHHVDCGGGASTGGAALARFRAGGALDTTFGGGDGKVTTTFFGSAESDASFADMALEEGGQIVATGAAAVPNSSLVVVIVGKYLRNGQLNPAFSADGRASARGPFRAALGHALFEDFDGRPVVAGVAFGPENAERFLLARFRAS